jgi:hypothetical protein
MYDTSVSCTYDDLDSYQCTILKVFNTEFESLTDKMNDLYDRVKTNDYIKLILQKICITHKWATSDMAFYLLFSYENFMYAHPFIVEILTNQEIKTYDALYSIV